MITSMLKYSASLDVMNIKLNVELHYEFQIESKLVLKNVIDILQYIMRILLRALENGKRTQRRPTIGVYFDLIICGLNRILVLTFRVVNH